LEILCHSFDKFFNRNEFPAVKIDWSTAVIREKIDGSLIRLWYNPYAGGNWPIDPAIGWTFATNNEFTVEAELPHVDPVCKEEGWKIKPTTFKQLVDFALNDNVSEFADLPKNYTFFFECVSPYNRIIVPYKKTELYLLGARDNITDQEYTPEEINEKYFCGKFKIPKILNVNDPRDIQKIANEYDSKHEGFVVCDKYFNRVKIKGTAYVLAHHIRWEKNLSCEYFFEALKMGILDDIKSISQEYIPICEELENAWNYYFQKLSFEAERAFDIWLKIKNNNRDPREAKKQFAEEVKINFNHISSIAFGITKLYVFSLAEIEDIIGNYLKKLDFNAFCKLTGFIG
jgi:hypothetical protein